MKPNEPSRTALMIARQRAAHQVLDHGSILYDPFAMKILRADEKEVLQFANGHPLASIGRLFTTARSRIAEEDRKSTRLNSSHGYISYAVFCLKKKKHHMKQHNE